MKRRGFADILRRKQYVIAGTLVIIAAIGTTVLYSNNREKERVQMEAELAQEMNQNDPEQVAAAEDTESAAEASTVIPPKKARTTESTQKQEITRTTKDTELPEQNRTTETAEVTETQESGADTETRETAQETEAAQETAAAPETLHFSPEEGISWPMEGNVILNYSMDSTVYFKTLDQYKYNPAVIIAGDVNSKVYSVAKGQVTRVANDEVTGCTVTVSLGDGYEAVYGQLKELTFDEGDYVEAGHVIGYVSEPTKYFSLEGSNLYFELHKDGVPVDPVDYFQ